MANMLKNIGLTTIMFVLPLHLWRTVYPTSDWAIVFLAILATALFLGIFSASSAVFKSQAEVAVRANSPYAKWFTGRLRAGIEAIVFTIIAIPILAWQALTVTPTIAYGLIFLCVVSSGLSIYSDKYLADHLTSPFSHSIAIIFGSTGSILIFIPILAWLNWTAVSFPGEFREASLSQMVLLGLEELPSRRSWIAEVLSVFYAIEASKVWLVIQLSHSRWASILYSFDMGLAGIIVARASAVLTSYVRFGTIVRRE